MAQGFFFLNQAILVKFPEEGVPEEQQPWFACKVAEPKLYDAEIELEDNEIFFVRYSDGAAGRVDYHEDMVTVFDQHKARSLALTDEQIDALEKCLGDDDAMAIQRALEASLSSTAASVKQEPVATAEKRQRTPDDSLTGTDPRAPVDRKLPHTTAQVEKAKTLAAIVCGYHLGKERLGGDVVVGSDAPNNLVTTMSLLSKPIKQFIAVSDKYFSEYQGRHVKQFLADIDTPEAAFVMKYNLSSVTTRRDRCFFESEDTVIGGHMLSALQKRAIYVGKKAGNLGPTKKLANDRKDLSAALGQGPIEIIYTFRQDEHFYESTWESDSPIGKEYGGDEPDSDCSLSHLVGQKAQDEDFLRQLIKDAEDVVASRRQGD